METEKGPVEMQIVAFPPEIETGRIGRFWEEIKKKLWDESEKPKPTPLNISPKVAYDDFDPKRHVQLMWTTYNFWKIYC